MGFISPKSVVKHFTWDDECVMLFKITPALLSYISDIFKLGIVQLGHDALHFSIDRRDCLRVSTMDSHLSHSHYYYTNTSPSLYCQ